MKKIKLLLLLLLTFSVAPAFATCTLGSLNLVRDGNSQNTFIRTPSSCVDVRVLAANVAEVYTVQSGAQKCIFSADGNWYARKDAAAAVPGADVSDGSGSELNPTAWYVGGTTTIGMIAGAATVITISCYN